MLDGIPLPVVGLTAPALLGLAILMLLTGRLWTNNAYQEKSKEADRWREAYEAEREARATANAQTTELLELAKTTHGIIVAVFNSQDRVRQSEGSGVVFPTKN